MENLRQRLGFHSLLGGQPLGLGVRVMGEASRTGRGGADHSPLRRAGMREPAPASCSLCWQRRVEYQRPHVTWRKNPKPRRAASSYLGSSHVIRKQRKPRDSRRRTTLTSKASQSSLPRGPVCPASGGGRGEEGSNQSTPGSADVHGNGAPVSV